tara:strand:- start:1153 stop:2355 length:1203 start_codon:yes stop_codon:yes gene_type:complete
MSSQPFSSDERRELSRLMDELNEIDSGLPSSDPSADFALSTKEVEKKRTELKGRIDWILRGSDRLTSLMEAAGGKIERGLDRTEGILNQLNALLAVGEIFLEVDRARKNMLEVRVNEIVGDSLSQYKSAGSMPQSVSQKLSPRAWDILGQFPELVHDGEYLKNLLFIRASTNLTVRQILTLTGRGDLSQAQGTHDLWRGRAALVPFWAMERLGAEEYEIVEGPYGSEWKIKGTQLADESKHRSRYSRSSRYSASLHGSFEAWMIIEHKATHKRLLVGLVRAEFEHLVVRSRLSGRYAEALENYSMRVTLRNIYQGKLARIMAEGDDGTVHPSASTMIQSLPDSLPFVGFISNGWHNAAGLLLSEDEIDEMLSNSTPPERRNELTERGQKQSLEDLLSAAG